MMAMSNLLPAISLTLAERDPQAFAQSLGASFVQSGFAVIRDHGMSQQLLDHALELSMQLFALPSEIKAGYHIVGGGGARGYTAFGTECAKDANIHDLKEFWHIGQQLPDGHRLAPFMPPNIWPAELPGFRETFSEIFTAFEEVGAKLMAAIARFLALPANYFDEAITDGNSIIRLLHYPPVPENSPAVRAAAHEDINAITLLIGAEEAGLELLDRQGNWRPVVAERGEMVVNIGDMLQRLTNHRLPSTTHRVVNPRAERRRYSRYSMPFFLHFRPDYRIETLSGCIGSAHPNLYPQPITAHDYLLERLREIGLA